ncbi:hypothetical protein A2U01_0097643, partial [Trifolium medium]|nr:hypothetical protein [Trifolium medium]
EWKQFVPLVRCFRTLVVFG